MSKVYAVLGLTMIVLGGALSGEFIPGLLLVVGTGLWMIGTRVPNCEYCGPEIDFEALHKEADKNLMSIEKWMYDAQERESE